MKPGWARIAAASWLQASNEASTPPSGATKVLMTVIGPSPASSNWEKNGKLGSRSFSSIICVRPFFDSFAGFGKQDRRHRAPPKQRRGKVNEPRGDAPHYCDEPTGSLALCNRHPEYKDIASIRAHHEGSGTFDA